MSVRSWQQAGPRPVDEDLPRRLWITAGLFALAHIVLLLIGISQQAPASLSEGTAGIEAAYVNGDMTRMFAGGLIEIAGFVLMIPALVFLARAVGRRTESARWAAQTGLMCGVGYVAVTFATGVPAGAAAVYAAQQGLDLESVFAINNIRLFAYFLSLVLLGGHALSVAVAALMDGIATRWLGWGGVVTAVVLFGAPVLASVGQQDWGTLVWSVWWVGLGVVLVRHRPGRPGSNPAETATEAA